jgi:hypothetical protein
MAEFQTTGLGSQPTWLLPPCASAAIAGAKYDANAIDEEVHEKASGARKPYSAI